MSYRMRLKKNDKDYPIPEVGDLFEVVALWWPSTDDLNRPVVDVQMKPAKKEKEKAEDK